MNKERTCKNCIYYDNDCPFTRGKFMPYPANGCDEYYTERPHSNGITKEEQWIKESIENYIFAYTGKRTKISEADAQHFTASVISYLNLCTPYWKPSDEQMAALLTAVGDEKQTGSDVAEELRILYYDLKKLL